MATVKTVSVTYDRKLNLGGFNSAAVGITVWADIEEGDDLDATMRALWEMATSNVKAKVATFKPHIAAEASELFLGLPLAQEDSDGDQGTD
jgi:hypothetical protein